jgi:hypothetical protein
VLHSPNKDVLQAGNQKIAGLTWLVSAAVFAVARLDSSGTFGAMVFGSALL